MKNRIRKKLIAFTAGAAILISLMGLYCAEEVKSEPVKYHAVIIQAAGYLPDTEKPKEVNAITHATTKEINTYVLSTKLSEKLTDLNTAVKIVDFSECLDLKCLYPVEKDGAKQVIDLVIFAGPSYYSKQPQQFSTLFSNLKNVVQRSPHIVCTSLVPAWFPETKGINTIKHSNDCFIAASAKTVMGISILTPRKKKPGLSREKLDVVLDEFAKKLVEELAKNTK